MRSIRGASVAIAFMALFGDLAMAKDFPVAARFFAGVAKVDPEDLNTEMKAQNLGKIDGIAQLGVEALHTPFKFFEWGFRYTRRYIRKDEDPINLSTDFYGQIDQDSVQLIARLPFIKTSIVRADFFAGAGGTNTTFKIKSAGQDGELTRRESKDWFASPITSFGGSLGVGYKQFYFVVEGGVETNKVKGFKRTGNVNTNVETIDLSGSYVSIALMFDGVSASSK